MSVTLRSANSHDCPGILAVHVEAIRELCAGDYTEAQLLAWTAGLVAERYLAAIGSNVFLVAESDGRIIGFAEFAPASGKIVAVYVHPAHARKGVGTMLLRAIEQAAAGAAGRDLWLNSSITAEPFYARFGFVAGSPTRYRLSDGTDIPCIPMRRSSQ